MTVNIITGSEEMTTKFSYIYLRDNEWFNSKGLIKLGVTRYLINRESNYKTSEPVLGQYIQVYKIPRLLERWVDRQLKIYFKSHNVISYNQYNQPGGTEYYTRDIIEQLEIAMKSLKVKYEQLTFEEIVNQERNEYLQKSKEKLKENLHFQSVIDHPSRFIQKLRKHRRNHLKPYSHQQLVLDKIDEFYQNNDIGKIIWACGLGKALLSVLITDRLRFQRILVGVPSVYLQQQFEKEILKLFPNKANILCLNGESNLNSFIWKLNNDPLFVITTYHSCHLALKQTFDFKIGDECHHLVGNDPKNHGFRLFHKIPTQKTLYMTATEKLSDKGYSMDDPEVFGELIDEKSVKWAIDQQHITDYQIVCLKSTKKEIETILTSMKPSNHSLFTSVYMCLKSLSLYDNLTHILLYTNTIEESDLANEYISQLLEIIEFEHLRGMYHKSLHSKSKEDIEAETKEFRTSHCGIICCAYIFGEGVDLPELNGVCVACNMQSEIRVVQYLLRPNRKHNEGKMAYIILPYTDDEFTRDSENRVQHIVWQMRNVDETIEQKIVVYELKPRTTPEKPKHFRETFVLSSNPEELRRIKVRLRYSKALYSDFTEEEDEYQNMKVLNQELNLTSKMEYVASESIHSNYIRDAETYFRKKGVWTNWYDFLGTNTTGYIQTKQEWVSYCKHLKIDSIEHYKKVAETDGRLPKDPGMFYRDFGNIPSELGLKSGRR
jgi:superfamily II DNA or RNA helicase